MAQEDPVDAPVCTAGERAADALVHALGLTAGLAGASWLLSAALTAHAPAVERLSLAAYGAGLVGMLAASAAYHLSRPGRLKEMLRRIDHAMIFVMIAGSYTPFTLNRLAGGTGVALCTTVWTVALGGVGLKLAFPRRFERLGFALYLALGWAILSVAGPLLESMAPATLLLLGAGGIIYTVGAVIHTRENLPYHTALWHALVVAAASCHFAAVAREFVA